MMNYLLAVLWLLIGAGLFLYPMFTNDQRMLIRLGEGTKFNAGWLALLLALWNGVRIWSRFSQEALAQKQREVMVEREKRHQEEPPVTNPQFRFDKPEDQPKK
ncbi:MAG: hypothetical protein EXR99_11320 [Gemmataceae bacterium]|nr:hypothetical protein [Gemmataceae bacterium]